MMIGSEPPRIIAEKAPPRTFASQKKEEQNNFVKD
jgi:hypothetical protein